MADDQALGQVMTPSSIVTYMNGVEKLGGTNFTKWKGELMLILAIMDRDHSFREDKPVVPVSEGDNDATLAWLAKKGIPWRPDHKRGEKSQSG
ncbi:hypothetical protein GUJ93_ZPchr0008g13751 [Zizania palustris]|uniref:Uncharacterized protein n=1 Tax=Zizania palustris TaxID=103762 RepID=A0A8J5RHR9_ZIZPA|nr:hypothetical protein GUJ93_ZPchr0008g13751 [Zizania palustris]